MTDKEFSYQYALGTLSSNRLEVLAFQTSSKYILTILSKDESRFVRYWVSQNPNTPPEVKASLSPDDKYWDFLK